MTIQTKTIGRMPTDHGPYDPNLAYGKKFCATLFGCMWESLHDNNNTAPAAWDGGDTITPNLVDWKKVSGDYEAWLLNKDKPATTGTTGDYPYNGMGRVVLKKNMVGGVNVLTEDAFYTDGSISGQPLENTVFVIKYDFVLSEDITIPDNCVLEFEGGSISAGNGSNMDTITGQNTGINAGLVKIFGTDLALAGTWNNKAAYSNWFDFDITGNVNNSQLMKNLSLLASTVYMNPGTYLLNDIQLTKSVSFIAKDEGVTFKSVAIAGQDKAHKNSFSISDVEYVVFDNIRFEGLGSFNSGGSSDDLQSDPVISLSGVKEVSISNCTFAYFLSGTLNYSSASAMLIRCIDCNEIHIEENTLFKCGANELIVIDKYQNSRNSCNVYFRSNTIRQINNGGANGFTLLSALCNKLYIEDNTITAYRYNGSLFNCYGNYTYCNRNIINNDDTHPLDAIFDNCEYGYYSGEYFECVGNSVVCPNAKLAVVQAAVSVIKDNNAKCLCAYIRPEHANITEGTDDVNVITIENNNFDLTYRNSNMEVGNSANKRYRDGIGIYSRHKDCQNVSIVNNHIKAVSFNDSIASINRSFIKLAGVINQDIHNNTFCTDIKMYSSSTYTSFLSLGTLGTIDGSAITNSVGDYKKVIFDNNRLYGLDGNLAEVSDVIPCPYDVFIPSAYSSEDITTFPGNYTRVVIKEYSYVGFTYNNMVNRLCFYAENSVVHYASIESCKLEIATPVILQLDYDGFVGINDVHIIMPSNKIVYGQQVEATTVFNIVGKSYNEPADICNRVGQKEGLGTLHGQTIQAGTPVRLNISGFSGLYTNRVVIPLSEVEIDLINYPDQDFPKSGSTIDVYYNGVWWQYINSRGTKDDVAKIVFDGIISTSDLVGLNTALIGKINFDGSHMLLSDNNYKSIYRTNSDWVYADGNPVS